MSTEENKAIARRLLDEAWNLGRVEQLDEYYAPDGTISDMTLLKELKDNIVWWHKAAPGFKFTILNILAEGETVMVHWQVDLTYTIPTEPLPDEPFVPLGKPVCWRGVDILRIENGKIVSKLYTNLWYEMLVKLGAIPLEKIKQNKAAVRKFVDAVNRQDTALLAEVCTPEVAKNGQRRFLECIRYYEGPSHRVGRHGCGRRRCGGENGHLRLPYRRGTWPSSHRELVDEPWINLSFISLMAKYPRWIRYPMLKTSSSSWAVPSNQWQSNAVRRKP